MSWKKLFIAVLTLTVLFTAKPTLFAATDVERLDVRITIRPTLMLRVVPTGSRGGSDIDLGTFYPGERWKNELGINDFRGVILAVTSNLGMRYQIFQESSGPLQTDGGEIISEKSFRVFTIGGSQSEGRTLHPEVSVPVTQEPLLLFTSDEAGTSDFFTAGYIVDPIEAPLPATQPAGTYTTTITYTVAVI